MSFFTNFAVETEERRTSAEPVFSWPWLSPQTGRDSRGRRHRELDIDELRAQLDEARQWARTADRRADGAELSVRLAERRLADLRRRQATLLPLTELFDVLDDIDRAEAHGDELTGLSRSVAIGLRAIVRRAGFVAYGRAGDTFDPEVHDAIDTTPGRTPGQVVEVLRRGYARDGQVVRPAQVRVTLAS